MKRRNTTFIIFVLRVSVAHCDLGLGGIMKTQNVI